MIEQAERNFITVFPTAFGWMAGAWRGKRLAALTFNHPDPQAALRGLVRSPDAEEAAAAPSDAADHEQRELIARLQAYADGADDDFRDVALDLSPATGFQRRVLHYCRRIPAGKVLTYGQLAAKAGSPGAARAVGRVMATNRWPLIVPCHRVVASGARLGGFSAPEGLAIKERLLQREGVVLRPNRADHGPPHPR
jgi:methylated-DNA-[protein]-cysteine S-methyltransferase